MANKITRIQGGTLRTARAQDATVGMNLQTYNGEYNVTPTTEQQTLATRNRLLTNNITVDPMSTDYEILSNKPQINDVTLVGNKSLEDLGIASEADLDGKQDAITASGILKGDGNGNITAATAGTDYGTYSKPSGGIPSSDMASAVQTSLGKANTAYQKPSGGIPASDLASGVIPDVSGFYTKPSGGIPADDIADGVIPDVSGKLDAPSAAGTLGQVLTSDGEGGQTWEDPTGGGTTDYTDLDNKPTINSVTLEGDLSLSDLGIAAESDIPDISGKLDAPSTAGTQGQVLTSDGNGGQTWEDAPSGGTDDYTDLDNKPQINSVTLTGNKSLSDLSIASASDLDGKQAKITASGILKGDGSGGVTAATAGTDYGTYSKPSGGIPSTDMASAVQTSLGKADTAYQLPSGGMTSSDMASAVQTSLGKADTAYQKPTGGIPSTDMTSAVQTSLGKADSAYQKPSGGIPGTDLASGVIPDISGKLDAPSTAGTNGQVLTSNGSGGQTWQTISGLLPTVSASDNGKFLRVSNGAWAAETVPTAVGVSF